MEKFKSFLASTLGKVVVTIVSAVVIYGLFLIAASAESFLFALIVFGCCAYFGWRTLSFITPRIFLIMPLAGWVVYFLIKGVLSFFLGFIVAPFQIGIMISRAVGNSISEQ